MHILRRGQNTSYFFKFDVVADKILKAGETAIVNTNSFYSHQYMTNIMDPYSQSSSVYNMYAANGNIDADLNFIIPVYENMPELNTRPTKYTEQDGELCYAIKMASVKDSPTFASNAVYTLNKAEIAVMVNRKCTFSDGVYWDIVMLENGWNVYVQTDLIKLCNDKKVIIDDNKGTITMTPNTTVQQVIETLSCNNYSIIDNSGGLVDKQLEKTATGYKINVLSEDNKTIIKTYTFIKVGDVNGDGKVIALDALEVLKHTTGRKKLEGIYLQSADVAKNGNIQAIDALTILKYSTGKSEIYI